MGWTALLTAARPLFRAPSFALFTDLLTGWVLAPGRRTITAMIAVADPACGRAHDAYHRFVRDGAWSMSGLWRLLAIHAVATFAPSGVVSLDCDDTLFHKSGRRVAGAGTFATRCGPLPPGRLCPWPEPGRGHPACHPTVG